MSVMERRLQLLLDHRRFELIQREATRSGRSVAAVIREAIDVHLGPQDSARASGARDLLARTEVADPHGDDWDEIKRSIDGDLARAERS